MSGTISRRRGRPPLLTHERILSTSLELLEEAPLENFTMHRIARRLNVAPMTLYGYFPSREALLQGIAKHVFQKLDLRGVLEAPTWEKQVETWCWSVRTHLQALPQMVQLISNSGELSSSWMEASDSLVQSLTAAKLPPAKVALYTRWVGRCVIGAIVVEAHYDQTLLRTLVDTPDDTFPNMTQESAERLKPLVPYAVAHTEDTHFALTVESMLRQLHHECQQLEGELAPARKAAATTQHSTARA